MIYLKNFHDFKKYNESNTTTSSKMHDLIKYFEMSHEEKIQLLPEFFYRNYPNIFDEWCSNNVEFFEEVDYYNEEDVEDREESYILPDSIYSLLQYPEAYDKYCNYLYDISYSAIYENDNKNELKIYLLPPFLTFTYEGLINNKWLCHFCIDSESVESIIESKYFHGVDDIDTLTITGANENSRIPDGYCFAYSIDNTYYNFNTMWKDGTNYGTSGVIFKSSGIELYHAGDNELQVIFIGNTATNMVGFHQDEKTKIFYTLDKSISDINFDDFKEKVINSGNVSESITVYHGTQHKFDKFTTNTMGSGEGRHDYGWGLYFTDTKEIANQYGEKVYNVTIHKGKTPKEYTWLEWDKKPTKTIINKILKGLNKINIDFHIYNNHIYYKRSDNINMTINLYNGATVYNDISCIFMDEHDKNASLFLLKNGIDGIKYVPNNHSKSFNYVVFDENAIMIDPN